MYAQQQQQQQEAAWQSVEERLCLLKKHVGTDSFVDNNPCILNDRGAEWLPSGRSRDSEVEIWHGYHYHYHYHLHVCRSKLCNCASVVQIVWADRARPTVSRLGPDFWAYVHCTPTWKRFGEYEQDCIQGWRHSGVLPGAYGCIGKNRHHTAQRQGLRIREYESTPNTQGLNNSLHLPIEFEVDIWGWLQRRNGRKLNKTNGKIKRKKK